MSNRDHRSGRRSLYVPHGVRVRLAIMWLALVMLLTLLAISAGTPVRIHP
jgi:hypothetical protein